MSNKTQLQTNNTQLDTLITRINAAKDTAASLPEAGGGGSAEIKTCNVTIRCDVPLDGTSTLTYVDSNQELQTVAFSMGGNLNITVQKNSFIIPYGPRIEPQSDDSVTSALIGNGAWSRPVYFITQDTSFYLM